MNVTVRGRARHYRTVTFDRPRNSVLLIEQRLLPHEFKIIATNNYRETARAITDMIVRGAGAIGATAAYGLAQGALAFRGSDLKKFSRSVPPAGSGMKFAITRAFITTTPPVTVTIRPATFTAAICHWPRNYAPPPIKSALIFCSPAKGRKTG